MEKSVLGELQMILYQFEITSRRKKRKWGARGWCVRRGIESYSGNHKNESYFMVLKINSEDFLQHLTK